MPRLRLLTPWIAALALAACAAPIALPPDRLVDGEIAAPPDYRSWTKFLSEVQRPDAKQVREIYMNRAATQSRRGEPYRPGSVFVMENYAAKVDAEGNPVVGPDGKLIKGELLRVFVMGKNTGWGQEVPELLRNGQWIYASYLANGQKGPEDLNTCRGCHASLRDKPVDFIFRHDEHFAKKAAALVPAVKAAAAAPALDDGQRLLAARLPW